jgi:serine/threonine protein kinase/tetratricopeptide (TPR) repeat protein
VAAAALGSTGAYQPIAEGVGTIIGPYKLLQQIGEGGFGVVYMAEQMAPVRRKVAFKIIKPGMDTKEVIARFESERQALALMEHPNIAKVLDAGATDSGRPYFVMELVKGVPIHEYCDKNNLSTQGRLELFMTVCRAVQHAHQKGIIHRDLKPSNVMVTLHDGRPVSKVIDFGVAKATNQRLTERTLFTSYGQMIGTPAYMSPEQAEMSGLDIDTRSDVYSLGVLLYELLTGSTPFDGTRLRQAGHAEMQRIIREEEPPRPSTRLTSLGARASVISAHRSTDPGKLAALLRGDLDWIVMKALEKDRNRRYETPNALAADIERSLRHEAITARAPSTAYRLRKFAQRNKATVATAVLVVAALSLGTVLSTWQAVRATRAEHFARDEWDRATRAEAEAKQEHDTAVRERARADQEAAVARAVNDFLTNDLLRQADSFAQADRQLRPDPDVKVRTLLDRAAKEIEGKFRDQPTVEAGVRRAIGEAYMGITDGQQALTHLTRAVELQRAALGPDHPDTLATLDVLVPAYLLAGRPLEGVRLGEQLRQRRTRLLGPDHRDTLATLSYLALAYQGAGRTTDAIALGEQVRERQTRVLGADHPNTLLTVTILTLAYQTSGRLTDAIALMEQVRDKTARLFTSDHPWTLVNLSNLADCYQKVGRIADALALYEQIVPKVRSVLGPQHVETSLVTLHWAGALDASGQSVRAAHIRQEWVVEQRTQYAANDPRLANTLAMFGTHLLNAGQVAASLPLHEETLRIRKAALGPDHPDTLDAMTGLANAYWSAGRLAEAVSLYEEALALERVKLGPDHPTTLNSLETLASAYRDAGRFAEAVFLFEEVVRLSTAGPGADDLRVASAKMGLGQTLIYLRKYGEAEPPLREGLAMRQKALPGTWVVASAQSALGAALAGQRRYAEAEPLLVAACEGLTRTSLPLRYQNRLSEALERLVQLYEACGKPNKAAKWRKKLEEAKAAAKPPPKL